jgi:hypothetical protein
MAAPVPAANGCGGLLFAALLPASGAAGLPAVPSVGLVLLTTVLGLVRPAVPATGVDGSVLMPVGVIAPADCVSGKTHATKMLHEHNAVNAKRRRSFIMPPEPQMLSILLADGW